MFQRVWEPLNFNFRTHFICESRGPPVVLFPGVRDLSRNREIEFLCGENCNNSSPRSVPLPNQIDLVIDLCSSRSNSYLESKEIESDCCTVQLSAQFFWHVESILRPFEVSFVAVRKNLKSFETVKLRFIIQTWRNVACNLLASFEEEAYIVTRWKNNELSSSLGGQTQFTRSQATKICTRTENDSGTYVFFTRFE